MAHATEPTRPRTTTRGVTSVLLCLVATTLASAPALAASAAQTGDTIERGFDVSPGGELFIDAGVGSIEVTASGSDRVEVIVHREVRARYADDAAEILRRMEVDFSQHGDSVRVEGRLERSWWRSLFGSWPLKVRYEVTVPTRFDLDLETSGGNITVSDLDGEIEARTSGGNLRFGDVGGPVHARTSGGNIELDGAAGTVDVETSGGNVTIGEVGGSVRAETSGGSIVIDRSGGEVDAHTSGGNIRVEEVRGRIDAHTSGGAITARITEQPAGDCRLQSSGGSLTVYLAEGIGLDVDAHTGGGSISTDFPVAGSVDRDTLKGEINGGGPKLVLRTSGGGIRIREL